MSYTLATVRNRVLDDKLDDPSYDPAVINRFINDTQRSIFNSFELPFMEKVFNGVLPIGGTIFTFPIDYQMQQSLVLVSPTDVKKDITDNYIPFREFNRSYPIPGNNEAGTPSVWTVYGNNLYFNRPTDTEYTLSLYYLKKPLTLTDNDDVPEIPEEFEEALVLGAYYRVLQRNEDFDQASFIKNGDYADEVDKLTQRLGKRQSGKTMTIGQPFRMGVRTRRGRR